MNTSGMNTSSVNTGTPMNTFGWLLKREYWEHRGGFMRAPFITAMIFLALNMLALIWVELTAHRLGITVNNLNLGKIAEQISNGDIAQVTKGIDIGLFGLGVPIAIVLSFVVFFYLIGALYDDRRDRSVLFWKSLPLSDTQTVLSKVVAAAFIAPALAVVAMIGLHLGFLILLSLYALLHGINPFPLLWSPLHMLALWFKLVVLIPVNALWALPCIGWLLLCSSFARSKPFLWAVALPVIAGIMVGFAHVSSELSLPSSWFWQNIVGRVLLSVFPGSWINKDSIKAVEHICCDGSDVVGTVLSFDMIQTLLVSPDLWIGAAAGAAMIAAAIYFRRRRTEAYA
jgi:ABC-2 type transport system permease protein